MILLSVIMIIWGLASSGGPKTEPGKSAYIAIEIFVNCMLVIEVIVRMVAFKSVHFIYYFYYLFTLLIFIYIINFHFVKLSLYKKFMHYLIYMYMI